MGEWDGLEARLKDLGDEAARLVDDPLDAARVRRLADRRRLRRSVAAVLIAMVILISGGVGVYAVTSPPERHTPSPAGSPSSTPTPSPEPSEEISARGERIPNATSEPGGRQPVPPTYRSGSPYSPDPTPESPTPSETSTPSPSETSEEPEPEPTSTSTEDPDAHPTSEPTSGGGGGGGGSTQTAPPPSDETAGG